MPTTKDLLNNSTVKSLLPSIERVAVVSGSSVDLKGIGRKLLVILDAGFFADTSTLTVIIEECDSTGFDVAYTLHTFATLDNVATVVADLAPNRRWVRARATAVGDSISFAVEGIIYLERERPSGL